MMHCMRGAYRIGSPLKQVSSMRVSTYCCTFFFFLSLVLTTVTSDRQGAKYFAPATTGRLLQKVDVRGDTTLMIILHA